MSEARSPVIIIGMHRSGTTMVTALLEQLGVFMGRKQESNNEALFFLHLNDWLLKQAGGAWDHPDAFRHLLRNDEVRERALRYLKFYIRSPRAISFMGLGSYMRHGNPFDLPAPWGWKDPRNTFTLPIWKEFAPEASVIHVYRHGVDVASSLRTRERQVVAGKQSRPWLRDALYTLRPDLANFSTSPRCSTLGGAFGIWEEYMREADRQVAAFDGPVMEVQYEALVDRPMDYVPELAEFCGLTPSPSEYASVLSMFRKDRVLAYRNDPELSTFEESVRPRLAQHGYASEEEIPEILESLVPAMTSKRLQSVA